VNLVKHPAEREAFGVDIAGRLVNGEAIESATVAILRQAGDGWADVTSQFRSGESTPTVSESTIAFYLRARASNDQSPGEYAVKVTATLDSGRIVVAQSDEGVLPRLIVHEA
jgi:hypothetical protein